MSRPQGLPKTGGRQKGTPNRSTVDLKERIEDLLGQDLPGIILSKMGKLSLEKQVHLLLELMPYVYPRRKAVDVKSDNPNMTFSDFMLLAKSAKDQRAK